MKPISLRFRCFGPYMDEQLIDFEKLEETGLFLICGETGAGKTTILDAICYALYNQSSGSIRGKGLSVMRCKQAEKSDITMVEFLFSVNNKRYKFLRTLEYKRKKPRDEHQCWEELNGQFIPLFENPKESSVNAKAQELIGLTYDQFRQVIILPQGQFEKLLVSDSDEKERILVTLFHAGRWQQVAEEVFRRVKERDSTWKLRQQQCEAKLAEYGCKTTEELGIIASDLENRIEIQLKETSDAYTEAAAAQEEKEQAILLEASFRRLDEQNTLCTRLHLQKTSFDLLERRLQAAVAAWSIQPQYTQYVQQQQASAKAEAQLQQAHHTFYAAELNLEQIIKQQQKHEEEQNLQEDRRKRSILLESKIPLYTALQQQKRRADLTASQLSDSKKQLELREKRFVSAHESWMRAQVRQQDAIAAYQKSQSAYLQGIGGILAKQLQAGLPCPVCGSTDHPAPAETGEIQITEERLEQHNRAVSAAADAVSAAASQRDLREKERNDAAAQAAIDQQEAIAAAQAHSLSLEQRIPDIQSLSQLNAAIASTTAAIEAYEQEQRMIASRLQDAQQGAASAATRLETAKNAAEELTSQAAHMQETWEAALQQAGFHSQSAYEAAQMDPAEQQQQQERLLRYRQEVIHADEALQEQRTALSAQQRPDMISVKEHLKTAQDTAQALQRQLDMNTAKRNRIIADLLSLEKQLEANRAERDRIDADLEFADRLRGSRGLSLQRYVLGVMLSSITAEANRLLKHVYGGRYQLFRCQELGDRRQKGGLDLEVLDHANGQRRSVKTLSGGEKFLVALGLAIGLSTVVQAQGSGIRLGAMFIDEGFGSLDRDSICDALDILDGIRKGSGLVGIISHVEQLSEAIPTRIEVQKGTAGSKIVIKY